MMRSLLTLALSIGAPAASALSLVSYISSTGPVQLTVMNGLQLEFTVVSNPNSTETLSFNSMNLDTISLPSCIAALTATIEIASAKPQRRMEPTTIGCMDGQMTYSALTFSWLPDQPDSIQLKLLDMRSVAEHAREIYAEPTVTLDLAEAKQLRQQLNKSLDIINATLKGIGDRKVKLQND